MKDDYDYDVDDKRGRKCVKYYEYVEQNKRGMKWVKLNDKNRLIGVI